VGTDRAGGRGSQARRDERDASRSHSPLRPAGGAVVLDTTELSVDQVVERLAELVTGIDARAGEGHGRGGR
jgi:cytidylate kinase